jgi:hypothetical protein
VTARAQALPDQILQGKVGATPFVPYLIITHHALRTMRNL